MRLSKRIFDLVCSIIFILLSLPFWILIAIIIKIDSPGPVIFKQTRTGKKGIPFAILKFRSMYQGTSAYLKKPQNSSDPQITRVGRIMRDLGVDELPQLINVLKGEMSLVGPRPEMPFITEKYSPIAKRRLMVLPGITGLWQILAPKNEPIHEHLKYDLYYIKYQNFKLDFWILLKTLRILSGSRIFLKYGKNKNPAYPGSHDWRHENSPEIFDQLS